MGKPLWTSGMLNVVLEHVEEHKGKEGLYNTDRDAAYKDSRLRVCKGYPRRPVSVEQLKKQLEYVVRLHRRPEYIQDDGNKMELLYREGRKILRPECSQEQLLLRERQGRFGVKSAKKGSTAPPYAPAYRSPQTERDPSSSLSPSSETYEFTNGSYKSMAPYPNSTPMENFEATRDFLAVSPEVFLPSRKFLDQLRDHTIEGIRSAAYDFIDSTGVHSEMIPQLYKSLRSPSFADICKRVYDASTNEELLGKFASLQSMSALSLVDFIRALMAAVITDWIFEGSHAPFAMELMQKSQPQVMYENIIAELHPELHKQVLRKRNHVYMKQVDFKLLVPQHVNHFIDDLIPFINSIEKKTGMSVARWRTGLQHAFMAALELQAQVMLMGSDYVFRMPRTNDLFDPKSMLTEYGHLSKDGKVHVALFPALLHVERKNELTEERVMHQALVILQAHESA